MLDFATLRLRVRLRTAGMVDDAALEALARDKLKELWEMQSWSFREGHAVLATVAPHSEGRVTLNVDRVSVTGTSTAFTSADVGREMIVGNANSRYRIGTVASATQLTLAEPYADPLFTNSSYRIQQSIYPLPSDYDMMTSITWWHQLSQAGIGSVDRYDGRRSFTSNFPISFVPRGVNAQGIALIEISPVPSAAMGLPFTYRRLLPTLQDDTLILFPEQVAVPLIAAEALYVRAAEVSMTKPDAAAICLQLADKYQPLGLNALQNFAFQDLRKVSGPQAIRDEGELGLWSDDFYTNHDSFSPR